jgi:hypothetical protein
VDVSVPAVKLGDRVGHHGTRLHVEVETLLNGQMRRSFTERSGGKAEVRSITVMVAEHAQSAWLIQPSARRRNSGPLFGQAR